jgi:hypothetical protein
MGEDIGTTQDNDSSRALPQPQTEQRADVAPKRSPIRRDLTLVLLGLVSIWLFAGGGLIVHHRADLSRSSLYLMLWIVGSLLFVVASLLLRLLSLGPDYGLELTELQNRDFINTILHLRRRANGAQISAIGTIGLIICALVSGVSIYVYAGTIVDREQFRALSELVAPTKRAIETLERYARSEPPRKSADPGKRTSQPPPADTTQSHRDTPNQKAGDESLAQEAEQLRVENGMLEAENGGMKADLKKQLPSDLESLKTLSSQIEALPGSSTSRTISTVATRVGALVLVIFLVQVLVPLYRYSTRLAGFYSSRADALLLLHGTASKVTTEHGDWLRDLSAVLAPESVDFGKSPRTPLTEVASVVKEAAKKVGKE